MACMSGNDKIPSRYFGESLQMTNYILYSGATFNMTPQVSYFIPCSLEDTDKNIETQHAQFQDQNDVLIWILSLW